MFVSGKLPADLQQQLNKAFAIFRPAIEGRCRLAGEKNTVSRNGPTVCAGAIRIAWTFSQPAAGFGGFFGSRANIREDKGYILRHPQLQSRNRIQQSARMIATAGKDVRRQRKRGVREMNRLREEPGLTKKSCRWVRELPDRYPSGNLDGPFHIMEPLEEYCVE